MDHSERITVTREQLYEQVWTTPMIHLAKQYGISDVGLRKACKRFHIPCPRAGYWAKKQHGKTVRRTPLPEIAGGTTRPIVFQTNDRSPGDGLSLEAQHRIDAEKTDENRIQVPDALTSPHPIVEATSAALANAKPSRNGLVRPKGKRCLDIVVSPDNVNRVMRIADALAKALEGRGYTLSVGGGEPRATTITIMDETLSIRFEEELDRKVRELTAAQKREQEKYPWMSSPLEYDYFPSGRLLLRIVGGEGAGCRRVWRDAAKQGIENRLNSFVGGLFRVAEANKIARAEAERQRKEREEWERQYKEEQRRRQEEQRRRDELKEMLKEWREATEIRGLVAAFECKARDTGLTIESGSELDVWLDWARRRADQLDPVQIGA